MQSDQEKHLRTDHQHPNELNPLFLDDAYRTMKTSLMKKIAWTLLVWSMFLGTTASAQVKVATLDLQKVFDGYWKTKQISDNLQGQGKEYEEQREKLVQQFQKLNEEFRVLREAIEDPAASELGKEKRTKEADAKLAEIRELEQSINDYDNTTRTQITETQNRMKKNIVREIRETVAGIARKENYNMVLDIAALARTDTPIVLYHDGSADITEKVLTQMNAGAPVGETP
ncbi:MAG: OmpH family outer membrane protein [Limisphaerales bacterium]